MFTVTIDNWYVKNFVGEAKNMEIKLSCINKTVCDLYSSLPYSMLLNISSGKENKLNIDRFTFLINTSSTFEI